MVIGTSIDLSLSISKISYAGVILFKQLLVLCNSLKQDPSSGALVSVPVSIVEFSAIFVRGKTLI